MKSSLVSTSYLMAILSKLKIEKIDVLSDVGGSLQLAKEIEFYVLRMSFCRTIREYSKFQSEFLDHERRKQDNKEQ